MDQNDQFCISVEFIESCNHKNSLQNPALCYSSISAASSLIYVFAMIFVCLVIYVCRDSSGFAIVKSTFLMS